MGHPRSRWLRWYIAAVVGTGSAVFCASVMLDGRRLVLSPVFWTFVVVVVVLEAFAIRLPASQDVSEVTTSTTFAYALLLLGGVAPAAIALVAGAVANGVTQRKEWYKAAFNAGQFAIAAVASGIALAVTTPGYPLWGMPPEFVPAHLPGALFGAAVFMAVNFVLLEIVVDLSAGVPVWTHARRNLPVATAPMVVMLALSPAVAVVIQASLWFMPLLAVPIVALYRMSKIYIDKEHQALHDQLTGLPNRTLFRDRLSQALLAHKRQGSGVAFMMLDLDRFKEINDTLGHPAGDELLQVVAQRLSGALRETDTVARLGGDEFGIVLRDVDGGGASLVAENLLAELLTPVVIGGVDLEVVASIGISFALPGDEPDELIRRGDVAMYRAKALHLGVTAYDPEVDPEVSTHTRTRLALSNHLRAALGGDEIVVAYQPQVSLADGRVVAVEALARWHHPTRGLLGAASLIPIAESTGLIRQLSLNVLRHAVLEVGGWRRDHGIFLRVSVNLAAQNLMDTGLLPTVTQALEDAGLEPEDLCLEITEGDILVNPVESRAVVDELRRIGASVAIDDFGTGMSSLARLKDLAVDELKIDKSFIDALPEERSLTFVRAIVRLGHELGLRIVAEGVETSSSAETLATLAVDVGQGYLFAKPLWGQDYPAWHLGSTATLVQPPRWT